MKEKEVGRRTVLRFGLGVGALALLGCDLSHCETCEVRGEDASEPPVATPAPAPAPTPAPGPPAAPSAWVVDPPSFAVGSGSTFNLATTLPADVARGGLFDVSTSGARLPTGMTLTPAGILSVGTAAVGSVAGVIFTYSSP
jgi:hypothetical protein